MFVGVSNVGEVFGIELDEIDKTKNLIARINDRHIFPHARIRYMMRSVDANAERFVLAVNVAPANSVVRYREGDFNETVYIKGDGNSTPATPEDIISLSKRKYGVDNETSEILYEKSGWKEYLDLCREYRKASTVPTIKELQNEEIISKDDYAKSGFIMFGDNYTGDDSLICCRLMERGGTGFQTMIESYSDSAEYLQPVVLIYPGFLDLRLFDRLYEESETYILHEDLSEAQEILELLRTEGPKRIKELQAVTNYKSRSQFLTEVINPLIAEGIIYRDGNTKSPTARIKLKSN